MLAVRCWQARRGYAVGELLNVVQLRQCSPELENIVALLAYAYSSRGFPGRSDGSFGEEAKARIPRLLTEAGKLP
jgi:hypothetical protein